MELLMRQQPPRTAMQPAYYTFAKVEPASYILVEKNSPSYPGNVGNFNSTPEGDNGEKNESAGNRIPVVLKLADDDDGNDFVDNTSNGLPLASKPNFRSLVADKPWSKCQPNDTAATSFGDVVNLLLHSLHELRHEDIEMGRQKGFPFLKRWRGRGGGGR